MLAPLILRIYRALGSAFYPFAGILLRRRARCGKEDSERRYERYGYASHQRPPGPVIWLHAASVGESLAILPLVRQLETCGISLVVTTGTVTSAKMLDGRLGPTTLHQYVPFDMPKAVIRFIEHWKPDLAIFAESELWPTTIAELAARHVPQVLVNARMSDRSARRWQKQPHLSREIFGKLTMVTAQSSTDAQRFRDLGAPRVHDVGNLKLDAEPLAFDAEAVAELHRQIGDRPCWLALSTHSGEEDVVAKAHKLVTRHQPNALTILAPRHPQRADEVGAVLDAAGLAYARRSRNDRITAETAVYLADTIGETGIFLQLATVAFLGRSLGSASGSDGGNNGSQGGQNPVEPVLSGVAVLSGRYVQNFRDTYQTLLEAKSISLVADEQDLAAHVLYLWLHKDKHQAMTRKAQAAVTEMGGALERTIECLDPFIAPLHLKARLERHAAQDALQPVAVQ